MVGNAQNLPEKANPAGSLIRKFADKFGIDPARLNDTLKATAFSVPPVKDEDGRKSPVTVTNEQMAALLIVADQYGLNPFTREIYAFPDKKGGIVPVVGVDGWLRIINEHPEFDGMDFKFAPEAIVMERGKPCPEWIEVMVYRKDRTRPIIVREYLDECYRPAFKGKGYNGKEDYYIDGPWQSHTKRMMRHKAIIQAGRVAFGFAGIHDQEDAEEAINITPYQAQSVTPQLVEPGVDMEAKWKTLFEALKQPHDATFDDQLRSFVTETAEANECHESDLIDQAVGNIQPFLAAFEGWRKANGYIKPELKKERKHAEKTTPDSPVPVAESGGDVATGSNPVPTNTTTSNSDNAQDSATDDGPTPDEIALADAMNGIDEHYLRDWNEIENPWRVVRLFLKSGAKKQPFIGNLMKELGHNATMLEMRCKAFGI